MTTSEKIIERIVIDFNDGKPTTYNNGEGFIINYAELPQLDLKGFEVKGESILIFIPAQRVISVFLKDIEEQK